MKQLFQKLEEQMRAGRPTMLATVVAGSGSSPRAAGAHMAVDKNGRIYGTIGGGNMEYQATATAVKLLEEGRNHLQEYNLAAKEVADLGMVCGGKVTVLFYYLNPCDEDDVMLVKTGLAVSALKKAYWLLLPLGEGKAEFRDTLDTEACRTIWTENGREYYAEQYAYDGRVYIFGGGHLAQEVAPLLAHLGFSCVVADDREEFTRPELFPGAEQVLRVDFEQLEKYFRIRKQDYIAIMTRGHLCDVAAERFALRTEASYIGVVGSAKKTEFVRGRLMEEGFTEEELDRVTTPIGLDIDSETPAEIAVSIAGQLIQFRAGKYKN